MQIAIAILTLFSIYNLYLNFLLYKEINAMKQAQLDQAFTVIRLMYHKAMEIEDYEALAKITKNMPKDFEYDKFF